MLSLLPSSNEGDGLFGGMLGLAVLGQIESATIDHDLVLRSGPKVPAISTIPQCIGAVVQDVLHLAQFVLRSVCQAP